MTTEEVPVPGRMPKIAFVQDGSRMRYALPMALQRAGILERAFCDWFVLPNSKEERLAKLVEVVTPILGRRMRQRTMQLLDPDKILTNDILALWSRLRRPMFSHEVDAHIWVSRQTGKWILREGFGTANVLYGFVRNTAPDVFRSAKTRGLYTVGEQFIATADVELRQLQDQKSRWPNWGGSREESVNARMADFERASWRHLDHITCRSDFVRNSLVEVGVESAKISVLSYPMPAISIGSRHGRPPGSPLHVGFVGMIGLRKGAPYFLETARRFDPRRVRFTMVGDIQLNADKAAAYSQYVDFVGSVPRSDVSSWLEKFDVFFYPSTCEGSAGAVMEAMASGLPVLTTKESGTRVRDGIEGFILRYDDLDGFEAALHRLAGDEALRASMGEAAKLRVQSYTIDEYGKDLKRLMSAIVSA